jgi:hypothetical protein
VIQATTTSMYAIGVSASSVTAIKAVVVILVILLYSDQVRNFIHKITLERAHRQKEA